MFEELQRSNEEEPGEVKLPDGSFYLNNKKFIEDLIKSTLE